LEKTALFPPFPKPPFVLPTFLFGSHHPISCPQMGGFPPFAVTYTNTHFFFFFCLPVSPPPLAVFLSPKEFFPLSRAFPGRYLSSRCLDVGVGANRSPLSGFGDSLWAPLFFRGNIPGLVSCPPFITPEGGGEVALCRKLEADGVSLPRCCLCFFFVFFLFFFLFFFGF